MTIAANIVLGAGLVLMAISALGIIRLPGFFARVHAVSKTETLAIALVLIGLILHEGATLTSLKLGLVMVFVAVANPVAAHLLTRAAVRNGVLPWRRQPTAASEAAGETAGEAAGEAEGGPR